MYTTVSIAKKLTLVPRVGGPKFKSWTDQIWHRVANGSPRINICASQWCSP